MKSSPSLARSHLYTIRLWPEELGDGTWEWRGMVKHVASGKEHYFRDWSGLKELMVNMVGDLAGDRVGEIAGMLTEPADQKRTLLPLV